MNHDPVSVPVLGLPGPVLLGLLTVIAFGVFARRVWRLIRVLRQARPENRFDQLGRRALHFARHVLLQPRLFNERAIGLPHLVIFWGFVLYAACFGWSLVRGLLPFLPIPYPDELGVLAVALEVFAVLVLIALAVAAVRRLFFTPPHLHLSFDADLILALIALLMVSTLLGQGFRRAAGAPEATAGSSMGGLLAPLFAGMTSASAQGWAHAMWWVHMVTVLFFLAYLPHSKHLHLLAAPFNVFFGCLRPLGDLTIVNGREEVAAGASKWDEFTWKQLLSGFSCAECGRCDRACPAVGSGSALSPQQVIQKLKRHVLTVGFSQADAPAGKGNGAPTLLGGTVSEAEVWACTTCLACMERCAVFNEQIPIILQMRRHLVTQGRMDRTVQDMLTNVTRYGNSFGKSDRLRAKWTLPLGCKIKDARREPVEYLWYVGDYASFDPRVQKVTRTTAKIFQQAGLDFGLLYEGERNAGNDVRRVGEEGLFDMLRERNLQTLRKAHFETLVTTDPHTYNTLKNEYGFHRNGVAVLHYTEVLDRLVQRGQLPLERKLTGRVTYHDPCYLGRYNAVYEPPRRVLRVLGVEVVEMPRHRNQSYCCGAGGGRIWMEDTPGLKERPSESRVREAAALPGVSTLVVTCPKDIAMFRDALKTTGHEGKLVVKDLAELVGEAMAVQQNDE
jgi:Fe-S oxidoreductase